MIDSNNNALFALSEDVSRLRSEVTSLRRELSDLKRAILHTPAIGEQIQRKLWE